MNLLDEFSCPRLSLHLLRRIDSRPRRCKTLGNSTLLFQPSSTGPFLICKFLLFGKHRSAISMPRLVLARVPAINEPML